MCSGAPLPSTGSAGAGVEVMESTDLSAMTASDGWSDTRIGRLTHGLGNSGAKYRLVEIQTLTEQEMKQKPNKWDDDCV